MSDLISVIMPVHSLGNMFRMFYQATTSIIDQTYANWELIILVDGIVNEDIKFIQAMKKKDNRIRAFVNHTNVGPGISRNMASQLCNGNYLIFHDSDDLSRDDRFEILMSEIKNGHDVVATSFIEEMHNPFTGGTKIKHVSRHYDDILNKIITDKKIKVPFHLCSCIMTKDFFNFIGGFEKYKYSSDSILAIKIGLFNNLLKKNTHFLDNPVLTYRRHGLSVTQSPRSRAALDECQTKQREVIVKFMNKHSDMSKLLNLNVESIKEELGIVNNIDHISNYNIEEI